MNDGDRKRKSIDCNNEKKKNEYCKCKNGKKIDDEKINSMLE